MLTPPLAGLRFFFPFLRSLLLLSAGDSGTTSVPPFVFFVLRPPWKRAKFERRREENSSTSSFSPGILNPRGRQLLRRPFLLSSRCVLPSQLECSQLVSLPFRYPKGVRFVRSVTPPN